MKKQLTMAAFAALLISGAAMAFTPPGPQNDHGRGHHAQPQHSRGNSSRGYVQHERGSREGWYKKGGHVPANYRGSNYVVTDWRTRHLRQPPRGYHWVRSDNGDYLMVAITTGLIASIIAASH